MKKRSGDESDLSYLNIIHIYPLKVISKIVIKISNVPKKIMLFNETSSNTGLSSTINFGYSYRHHIQYNSL